MKQVDYKTFAESSPQGLYYHGTSTKFLPSIMKNGLLTPKDLARVTKRTDRTTEVNVNSVYLTTLNFIADHEARQICDDNGGEPVVLLVSYVGDLKEDPEYDWEANYLEAPSAFMTSESIPAKNVVFWAFSPGNTMFG
ncbi:hypothetical protein Goe26_00560 [Bacillus phage vB_BsuM-Goe26]|nr:hypothetical protein Goe26_00560 [Bacillus phage vB_BsuM-Goe26]